MSKLYHSKIKNEFLEQEKSKDVYRWLFDKSFEYEAKHNKDLFDFNKAQILDFLGGNKLQMSTLELRLHYIDTYIRWAIKREYKLTSNNPVEDISNEDLKEIKKPTNNVLHVDTVYELAGRLEFEGISKPRSFPPLNNRQDSMLLLLLFLGVYGKRASELINLKFEHIENNVIKLSEIDSDRIDIPIDDFGMELLELVKKETVYTRYMNDDVYSLNDKEDYDIASSEYVIRKSKVGRYTDDGKISYQGLLRRMQRISDHSNERMNMKRVRDSGVVYIAKMLHDKGVELKWDSPIIDKVIFQRYHGNNISDRMKFKHMIFIKKELKEVYGVDV